MASADQHWHWQMLVLFFLLFIITAILIGSSQRHSRATSACAQAMSLATSRHDSLEVTLHCANIP